MLDSDRLLLSATIDLAEQGRFTCAPNPTVGCIIVRDGEIIGRGFHAIAGQGHAEVQAIADAKGDVAGATVYVSLEPCAFEGRTPACSQTLIDAQVARVVIAASDPHPQVSGQGVKMLEAAGIKVDTIELPEAHDLIAGYVQRITHGKPLVRIKTASSLDGAVALANGDSQWITGDVARADVQQLRARSDAIITGIGTVLADDPQLTVRLDEECKQPIRVVLDRQGRMPGDCRLLADESPVLLVQEKPGSYPDHVTVLKQDPRDLDGLLSYLADAGCNEVLVEAGPAVVTSFVAQGLWQEWIAYIAPKVLGSATQSVTDLQLDQLANAVHAVITEVTPIGADLRLKLVPASG